MTTDILIINACILPHPGTAPPSGGRDASEDALIGNGFAAIRGNRFAAVGPMSEAPEAEEAATVIDAGGNLLMPGLVNGHCHGAMTLFRGLADDLPLAVWLEEHIFPAEARAVSPEMVAACTRLAAAEMIMAGVTLVADSYFYEEEAARAFAETGLRAVAAQGVIDFPAPGVPDPAENVAHAAAFVESVRAGGNDLITPAIFCHSPYTCGPDTLSRTAQAAADLACPLFIHLAETEKERKDCLAQHGIGPAGYLDRLGFLGPNTVCVHGVRLDDADLDCLAARGARLVTCPESNMKLAAGTAPVPAMRERGIPVALGTDGPASNNDLDIFAEMGSLARHQKGVSGDAAVLSAPEVLAMATGGGAAALGLADLGRIEAGALADCIIVDLHQPHFTPFYNESILVYAASGRDVTTTIVNGRLLMHQRRLLSADLDAIIEKVVGMTTRQGPR